MCNYSSSPGNSSQNPLDQQSYLSVRLLEMVLSCCFFPYLESPYYDHGSYKTVLGHLVIIVFYQRLSDTFVSARNNIFVKWQTISDIAGDINKVIGRQCHIKSQGWS